MSISNRMFLRLGVIISGLILIPLLPSVVFADVTFTTPDGSNPSMSYCQEYFHDEWGIRLSMDDAASGAVDDINLQVNQVDALTYSNGKLSYTTTGTSSYLTLLQYTTVGSIGVGSRYGEHHPIDSSTYRLLSFRMYSSEDTIGRVRWFHLHDRWALATFNVYKGWHTYQLDIPSLTPSLTNGSNTNYLDDDPQGLEIFPSNESGVSIEIDWIQLTKPSADCPEYTVSYNATSASNNNLFSIIADTNTDYTDGISSEVYTGTAAGNGSVALNSSKLVPGTYNVYAIQSGDWASLEQRDPFDMNESTDIKSETIFRIANSSFAGGSFSGTTSDTDASFFLNLKNGATMDPSVYKYVSIGLTLSAPNALQLFLFDADGNFTRKDISTFAGSQVYQFELLSSEIPPGDVVNIRIDPTDASGVSFSLDFIAFRQAGYVNSLSAPSVSAAPGTLTVSELELDLLQPDKAGGRDYAQHEQNDSWNMNTSNDVSLSFNVLDAYIHPDNNLTDPSGVVRRGDFYSYTNIPFNGDSNTGLLFYDASLDTSRYVNFCFRGWNGTESPSGFNSVARIIWQDPRDGDVESSYRTGDDIVMNKRAQTYCVDMRTEIKLEPELPDGSPNPWTDIGDSGNSIRLLRLDMNENEEDANAAYKSVIDYVHIRADHEAHTQYGIVVSADVDQEVSVYYNSTKTSSGGTLVGTLTAGRSSNVLLWNTSGVSNGTYYIYATATSNGNTLTRIADGRIQVNHSLTQDTTDPILECERPTVSSYEFENSLEIAGYALDDIRLATVEVTIDGEYELSIAPDKFHVGAIEGYAAYADSNTAGFQKFIDTTALAYGTHTVEITAYDTAGNSTSCSRTVLKTIGGNTPALTYPDPAGTPITLPISVSDPEPVLSASISNKTSVAFSVSGSGISSCETITIQGAKTSTFAGAVSIYSTDGAGSVARTASNVPKFVKPKTKAKSKVRKRAKKAKDDGVIYFRVLCDTTASNTVTLNAKSIKNKKKTASTETAIISAIKKKAR